jgi:hypothetical protein
MLDQRITQTRIEPANTLVQGFDGIEFCIPSPSAVCSCSMLTRRESC